MVSLTRCWTTIFHLYIVLGILNLQGSQADKKKYVWLALVGK